MRSAILSALLPLAALLYSAAAAPTTTSKSSATSAASSASGVPAAAQQTQPAKMSAFNVTFNFNSYDEDGYGLSTVSFNVADERSTVSKGYCAGSLNASAYGSVPCVPSSFQFTMYTAFPDFWDLQFNHT